jgi:uncharacterized phage-like protein YoqJ
MKNKVACFTGHRPNKLGGYDKNTEFNQVIIQKIKETILYLKLYHNITYFISGMALGVDQWAAELIIEEIKPFYPEIKLIAAIPCKDQYRTWPKESQEKWHQIIKKCDFVHYISKQEYNSYCMQRRNQWMVDNSKFTIAIWDGSAGGTKNCVEYAKLMDREILRINPKELLCK